VLWPERLAFCFGRLRNAKQAIFNFSANKVKVSADVQNLVRRLQNISLYNRNFKVSRAKGAMDTAEEERQLKMVQSLVAQPVPKTDPCRKTFI
jgi:hypothetical protein